MQKCESGLTVYFEDPYWVGVYERCTGGQLTVCKIVFGAEPKDYEVYRYLLENWHLLKFSPPVTNDEKRMASKMNPKRMQRETRKQMKSTGIGTKAQQAMQLQREEGKEARKKRSRLQREEEDARQFALKQEKRKHKHKGR